MERRERFEVSLKKLKEFKEEEKLLNEEYQKTHSQYNRHKEVDSKLLKLYRKLKKLHRSLDVCSSIHKKDLKEIAKKIIEAKENSNSINCKDYLLYDILEENFVSYINKGKLEYCITLYYTHLRHYDLKTIMNRIEEITNLKINEWYLNVNNKNVKLSLHLIKND